MRTLKASTPDLQIPDNYDIMAHWNNDINGNESEIGALPMGFKRENRNIIGYAIVNKSQKYSCIGDGIIHDGKEEQKVLIETNGLYGKGMYFYEYNYAYAIDKAKSLGLDIVGAVITARHILDFTDGSATNMLKADKEQFMNYIHYLQCKYECELSKLKSKKAYNKYKNKLNRLSKHNIDISDYIDFLDRKMEKRKSQKPDAIRFIAYEANNYLGIQLYQSTMLCIRDSKSIVEYFNPLNEQYRKAIIRDYFSAKDN